MDGGAGSGTAGDVPELEAFDIAGRLRRGLGGAASVVSRVRDPNEGSFLDRIKSAWTSFTPSMLGAVYLNYLPDLAPASIKRYVDNYIAEKRKMDTMRSVIHHRADDVIQQWRKFARLGSNHVKNLSSLMHDATQEGVDPDDLNDMQEPAYNALRTRFMALPPAGQELYRTVRDDYAAQSAKLDNLLVDNVQKALQIAERQAARNLARDIAAVQQDASLSPADKATKTARLQAAAQAAQAKGRWSVRFRVNRLRQLFETNKVKAPYFPLGRFGRHYVSTRNAAGELVHFSLSESQYDAKKNERKARRGLAPGHTVSIGILPEKLSDQDQVVKPSFIAEIEQMLPAGTDKDLIMDQIWQRYLRSLPELSTRARKIHRSKMPGYTEDAMRVYASHMFHAAHQMARLAHGLELQDIVDEMKLAAKEAPQDEQVRATQLADEMGKRHSWVMNPTGKKEAQLAATAAFGYYMAASPAAALVNLAQTPMVGIPILAGRFGSLSKATSAIVRASRNAIANTGLSSGEQRAMQDFLDSGLVDNTQSYDLQGVGEAGVAYNPVRARVMKVMTYMFHKAEVVNRRVTALAAYRLAIADGESHEGAVRIASDITWKTHFDYANSSRPRHLTHPIAKVLLAMRSYQINMLYRLGRDLHQSFKGATPQAKREARYQLAGILGMQALMAGGTGVAGYHTIFFTYGLMSTLFAAIFGGGDDEDDPFTAQEKFEGYVLDIFGPQLGGLILHGVPGHFLGVDLASRIGMPDLWFRSANNDVETGKDAYAYLLSSGAGAPLGILEQFLKGYDNFSQGHTERGFEGFAPKAFKDLLKSYRYLMDGVQTAEGDPIITADNVGYWAVIAQAAGFTPANISEKWDETSKLKGAEHRIKVNRQAYINGYAMAVKLGDEDGRQVAIEKIRHFNASPFGRTMPIKGTSLVSSIKHRAIATGKRERGGGVLIQNEALSQALRAGVAQPVE